MGRGKRGLYILCVLYIVSIFRMWRKGKIRVGGGKK